MISWGGVGLCHRQSFQGNTMKKTILISAILFAFSSVVSAQELDGDKIQSALDAGTYEVNGQVDLTGTIVGNNLQTGQSIQIKFAKDAKLSLESASNDVVSAQNGLIDFALGESGKLKITSNSKTETYTGMLRGNVNIKGGDQSQLSLITTGIDVPLADGHYGGLIDIDVDTVKIISGGDIAIIRQEADQSLKINARNIDIKGMVQQGGGGKTEMTGFDTLVINGGTKNAIKAAAGTMNFVGNENSQVTLTNNGNQAVIITRDEKADFSLTANTINVGSTDTKNSIFFGEDGSTKGGGKVSLNAKAVNLYGDIKGTGSTVNKLDIQSEKATVNGNITLNGSNTFMNLNGELVFNGNDATISNLTGDKATFTITKTDQDVSITNNNKALTLAATGDVNDEVGLDALKEIQLNGTKDGVQIIAHEGMYAKETTAVLDKNGNMTNIVTKENSVMSNVLDLASATTLSLNRILMNDVRKRMGDLRSSEGTHGVWARYDGGSLSGSNGLENDFTTIQIGADTILGADVPRLGVAFA